MTGRGLLLIGAVAAAAVAAWYFTSGRGNEVCTVCLSYQTRTRCATEAAGSTAAAAEEARRAACDLLTPTAAGRATCFNSPPTSVQCTTR